MKDVQHESFHFRARFSDPEGDRRARRKPAAAARAARSAKRKASVVLELLRGADLESTSRKYGVTAAALTEWRDSFLAAGAEGLKIRQENLVDEQNVRQKQATLTGGERPSTQAQAVSPPGGPAVPATARTPVLPVPLISERACRRRTRARG